MPVKNLLEEVKNNIEGLYGFSTGLDVQEFLVSEKEIPRGYDKKAGVLVNEKEGRLGLFYSDALLQNLEENNPLELLGEKNFHDFSVFVEELDHFLFLAEKLSCEEPFTFLETEIHGNITKYQAIKAYYAMLTGMSYVKKNRETLRDAVLNADFSSDALSERYEEAKRLSLKYSYYLDMLDSVERKTELKKFHRLNYAEKPLYIDQIIGVNYLNASRNPFV